MKTHNQRMDVIGNNISNVNTTAYKASEVTFKDVYYQTKKGASSGNTTTGGRNPTQIGYGSQLGTVTQIMSQSGFTYSDSVYNVALEGEGFFQVMDNNGNIFYTRSGKFSVDSYGNLADPNGNIVLGVAGDPTGIEEGQSQRINLRVPAVTDNNASSTKRVNGYEVTISASAPGEQGNIAFTIVNSDTPYATKTGDTLTIYMDLDQEFGDEALTKFSTTVMEQLYTDTVFTALLTGGMVADTQNAGQTVPETVANKLDSIAASTFTPAAGATTTPTFADRANASDAEKAAYDRAVYEALSQLIEDYIAGNATDANGAAVAAPSAAVQDAITDAKQLYTDESLIDFENKLNDAILQGGVGLEEGVLPLDVSFATLPPFSDVQALKSSNTIRLEDPSDSNVSTELTFTMDKAGEFGNAIEIDLKYDASVGSSPVAKWKDKTLTITVPPNTNLQKLQDAVTKAAEGNESRMITVTALSNIKIPGDSTATPPTQDTYQTVSDISYTAAAGAGGTATTYGSDFSTLLGSNTERLGLDGGRDNFFSDLATGLSTVTMTDGRLAAEQAVDDLESIRIDSDGTIYGQHAVHGLLLLGRIDIVTFENPMGLDQAGTSLWRSSLASGPAQVKIAGKDGAGKVVQSALEMSNVDLAQEFSDMIITQRGYQANSRVITVSDTMLEELVNLKR